jgi:hypothetical protein
MAGAGAGRRAWRLRERESGEREGRRAGRMDKVSVPGGREEKGEEKKMKGNKNKKNKIRKEKKRE